MNNIVNSRPGNNRAFAGLFLIALGIIYLLRQFDFFLVPHWLFSWEMILIVIGLATGVKNNFRNPGSVIMIAIGSLFLIGHIFVVHVLFFWPLVLIAVGIHMLIRKDYHWSRNRNPLIP